MVKPDSSVACIKLCRADRKTAEAFEFLCLNTPRSLCGKQGATIAHLNLILIDIPKVFSNDEHNSLCGPLSAAGAV